MSMKIFFIFNIFRQKYFKMKIFLYFSLKILERGRLFALAEQGKNFMAFSLYFFIFWIQRF